MLENLRYFSHHISGHWWVRRRMLISLLIWWSFNTSTKPGSTILNTITSMNYILRQGEPNVRKKSLISTLMWRGSNVNRRQIDLTRKSGIGNPNEPSPHNPLKPLRQHHGLWNRTRLGPTTPRNIIRRLWSPLQRFLSDRVKLQGWK